MTNARHKSTHEYTQLVREATSTLANSIM